jgi:hypothetical protein
MPLVAVARDASAVQAHDLMLGIAQREDHAVPRPYAVATGRPAFQQPVFFHAGSQVMMLTLRMQPAAIVADRVLRIINLPALQIFQRLPRQRQSPLKRTEHLAEHRLLFQLVARFDKQLALGCCGGEGTRTASTQRRRFRQRLVLAAFFHPFDELDHVARARRAVAAESIDWATR